MLILRILWVLVLDTLQVSGYCKVDNNCKNSAQSDLSLTFKSYCEPFNREEFNTSTSILFQNINGRLGNMMMGYALQLAIKKEYGIKTYLSEVVLSGLQSYFVNTVHVPPLEKLCLDQWIDHNWTEYNGPIQDMGLNKSWIMGKKIHYAENMPLLGTIVNQKLGWGDLMSNHSHAIRQSFIFKERFTRRADASIVIIRDLQSEKCAKSNCRKRNFVYIGVHIRRQDAQRDLVERFKLLELNPSYYLQAMDVYMKKFKTRAIFILVSDDHEWVRRHILKRIRHSSLGKNSYLPSNGAQSSNECNHTILSYGTFSFWAGFLSGGKRILPIHILQEERSDTVDVLKLDVPTFMLPDEGVKLFSFENETW